MKRYFMPLSLLTFFLLTIHIHGAINHCPNENPYHLLVNKQYPLSAHYIPEDLVIPRVTFQSPGNLQKNYMEATAAAALETMFLDARAQGIQLVAVSGYRSYSRQSTLYRNAIAHYGPSQKGTARPGESEHQTGLAMDINSISQSFKYTKEGRWLAQNAHHYGYIIRYPENKTAVTGYIYEPWHIRYVGKELATYCYTHHLTLEEVTHCCTPYDVLKMPVAIYNLSNSSTYELVRVNGTTYIKARELVNLLDGSILFHNQLLTLMTHLHHLVIPTDSHTVLLDTKPHQLLTKPLLIEHTYYLPMRSTVELLGYQLHLMDDSTLFIAGKKPQA